MAGSRADETCVVLVAGLGNPGAEYLTSRHNAGFMVIARLLAMWPERFQESALERSRCFTGRFRNRPLTLQMPQTYMNLSGLAVAGLVRRLKLAPENLLVVVDDLDLPLGRLRLREGGSDGGHNGLKSIISELGSEKFRRLRIGIGHPESGKTADYVLSNFEGGEAATFDRVLDAAATAVKKVLSSGMSRAMNEFNAWTAEPEGVNEQ